MTIQKYCLLLSGTRPQRSELPESDPVVDRLLLLQVLLPQNHH